MNNNVLIFRNSTKVEPKNDDNNRMWGNNINDIMKIR